MRHLVLVCLAACLNLAFSGFAHAQNCASIKTKICSLATFDPNPQTGTGGTPQCDTATPPSQPQIDAIEAAYELAPPKVRDDLCKITTFFINQNNSGPRGSWGRWENPLY